MSDQNKHNKDVERSLRFLKRTRKGDYAKVDRKSGAYARLKQRDKSRQDKYVYSMK